MTFDPKTLANLQYQSRRMRFSLERNNRRQVDLIHQRIDQILDNRPGVAGVASDGEVVYDNDSWLAAQVKEDVNTTAAAEHVLTSEQLLQAKRALEEAPPMPSLFGPFELGSDDDRGDPNGGGVGLLDRP